MTERSTTDIGKYKIRGIVGEGAMGVVYRATDSVRKRTVAIKVMSDSIARQQDQVSLSTFFLPGGTVHGPVPTSFQVNDRALYVPYYHTASVSMERKLPFEFYARAGYTWRYGPRSLVFDTATRCPASPPLPAGCVLGGGRSLGIARP